MGENREIFRFGQMDADNDEVIIKRKSNYIVGVWDDVHTAKSLILLDFLGNVRYMMTGVFQMILVAWQASVFDCYVQRVLIQTGLLESIKQLMFDGSALNGIVDGYGV